MIGLVLTLDYEVYGTGAGDFWAHMIRPAAKLLDIAGEFGARGAPSEVFGWRADPGDVSRACHDGQVWESENSPDVTYLTLAECAS
jgi:hypothetical protein